MREAGVRLRYVGATILAVLGAIASYVATYDLVKRFFDVAGYELIVASCYIITLSVLIIVWFIFRQYQTVRKEKYANIMDKIHNVQHKLRNMHTFMIDNEPKPDAKAKSYDVYISNIKMKFKEIMDDVANIYSMLSGTRCRACIKVLTEKDGGQVYVDALVRDSSSSQRWSELDTYRSKNNIDLLDENHIFKLLFSEKKKAWSYHCHDVRSQEGLFSTSEAAYTSAAAPNPTPKKLWEKLLPTAKQVPYRSTITCVIRHPPLDEDTSKEAVAGFLCVDSESSGAFEPRWDIELCFSFADALFHPTNALLKSMSTAPEQ